MLIENRAGGERILALVVALEILIFAFTGPNFLSAGNAFDTRNTSRASCRCFW